MRLVQAEAFAKEIVILKGIQSGSTNHSHSHKLFKGTPLYKLEPFLDPKGIVRVGGRMRRIQDDPAVILPKRSRVTDLVIQHFHEKTEHQGRSMTTNELRANGFWILGCSSAVSCLISHCLKCHKH